MTMVNIVVVIIIITIIIIIIFIHNSYSNNLWTRKTALGNGKNY